TPAMIESDPVLMSLEQRIERLEESVASLQESRPLAISQANTCAAPPVEDSVPEIDRLNSHVPSRTPWLIVDILRESRAMVRMFFDIHYRMAWYTRFTVLILLILIVTS